MGKYLRQHKRISMTPFSKNLHMIPRQFYPAERTCMFYETPLSKSISVTRNAYILTLTSIIANVHTFIAKCDDCGVCYRYQESSHSIHNYNDKFLLGIDLCLFLRNSLKQHIPIGSIVKVLERQLNTSLNSQPVPNAYLHFEALSDHQYHFNCSICGCHPKILILDLNQKANFECYANDLKLPNKYEEDDRDLVDCEKFWSNVELSAILQGFPDREADDFKVGRLGHLSSVKSQEMVIYWLTPNIERSTKMMENLKVTAEK